MRNKIYWAIVNEQYYTEIKATSKFEAELKIFKLLGYFAKTVDAFMPCIDKFKKIYGRIVNSEYIKLHDLESIAMEYKIEYINEILAHDIELNKRMEKIEAIQKKENEENGKI